MRNLANSEIVAKANEENHANFIEKQKKKEINRFQFLVCHPLLSVGSELQSCLSHLSPEATAVLTRREALRDTHTTPLPGTNQSEWNDATGGTENITKPQLVKPGGAGGDSNSLPQN